MTSKTIAMAAVAAGVAAMLTVAFTYSPMLGQIAVAQSNDDSAQTQGQGIRRSLTYFSTNTASAPADGNATAQAFCFSGDVLLTGGYTIGGFDSPEELADSVLFSNTALRMQNSTGAHEGWQAGLVNAGTGQLTIAANAVCLDVTPETG